MAAGTRQEASGLVHSHLCAEGYRTFRVGSKDRGEPGALQLPDAEQDPGLDGRK